MQRELDKYGLQLPAFSKIGGILANELSVDEAAGEEVPGERCRASSCCQIRQLVQKKTQTWCPKRHHDLTLLHPTPSPVHAAVLAINEAVEQGVAAQTMEALLNPNAMLLNLRPVFSGAYQEVLHRAKREKGSNARNRVRMAPKKPARGVGAHPVGILGVKSDGEGFLFWGWGRQVGKWAQSSAGWKAHGGHPVCSTCGRFRTARTSTTAA